MCLLIVEAEGFSSELMMEEQSEPSHFLPDIFYQSWKQASAGVRAHQMCRAVWNKSESKEGSIWIWQFSSDFISIWTADKSMLSCSTLLQEKTWNLKPFLSILLDKLSELEIKHCSSICTYHLALPLHFARLSLDEGRPNSCRDGGVSWSVRAK